MRDHLIVGHCLELRRIGQLLLIVIPTGANQVNILLDLFLELCQLVDFILLTILADLIIEIVSGFTDSAFISLPFVTIRRIDASSLLCFGLLKLSLKLCQFNGAFLSVILFVESINTLVNNVDLCIALNLQVVGFFIIGIVNEVE